jgi:Flagellar hook-length control protein FliK
MQFIMPSAPQPGNVTPVASGTETPNTAAVPEGSFDELIARNYAATAESTDPGLERPVTQTPQKSTGSSEIDKIADAFIEELFEIEESVNNALTETPDRLPVNAAEKQELTIELVAPSLTRAPVQTETSRQTSLPAWGLLGSLQETGDVMTQTPQTGAVAETTDVAGEAKPALQTTLPRILTPDGQMTAPVEVPNRIRMEGSKTAAPTAASTAAPALDAQPSDISRSGITEQPHLLHRREVTTGNTTQFQTAKAVMEETVAKPSVPAASVAVNRQTIQPVNPQTVAPVQLPANQVPLPQTAGQLSRLVTSSEAEALQSLSAAGLQVSLSKNSTEEGNGQQRSPLASEPQQMPHRPLRHAVAPNREPGIALETRQRAESPLQQRPMGPDFSARFARAEAEFMLPDRWQAPVQAMPRAMPQASNPAMPQAPNPAMPQAPNPAMPQASNPAMPQASNPAMPQASNPAMPQASNPAMPQPNFNSATPSMVVAEKPQARVAPQVTQIGQPVARGEGQAIRIRRPATRPAEQVMSQTIQQQTRQSQPAGQRQATLTQPMSAQTQTVRPQPAPVVRQARIPEATQKTMNQAVHQPVIQPTHVPARPAVQVQAPIQSQLMAQPEAIRQFAPAVIRTAQDVHGQRPQISTQPEIAAQPPTQAATTMQQTTAWWLRDLSGSRDEIAPVVTDSLKSQMPREGGVQGERIDVADPKTKGWSEDQRPRSGGPEGGLSNWPAQELTDERIAQSSHPAFPVSQAQGISSASPAQIQPEMQVINETQSTTETAAPHQPTLAPRAAAVSAQTAYYLRMSLRTNRREIMVNLDPPELGRMQIRLQQKGNTMIARISVQVPEVEAMLKESSEMIRERLSEQGLRVESILIDKLTMSNQTPTTTGKEEFNGQNPQPNGQSNQQSQSGTLHSDTTGGHTQRDSDTGDKSNQSSQWSQRLDVGTAENTGSDSADGQSEPAPQGRRLGVDIRA